MADRPIDQLVDFNSDDGKKDDNKDYEETASNDLRGGDRVDEASVDDDSIRKQMAVEEACGSEKSVLDENASDAFRGKEVHFTRGSTPESDAPTQGTGNFSCDVKALRAGLKSTGNADRISVCEDGNVEMPSSTWAFSARASIAPSKFDHMATLKMTYSAYKEGNRGGEGVPLYLMQLDEGKQHFTKQLEGPTKESQPEDSSRR